MLPDTISAPLAKALADRGYTDLTPVQSAVIAPEAAERDLLVSARTGSGKTVAFGLGIAFTLLGDAFRFEEAGEPLALVIAPTRELALQVQQELIWLYAPAGGRIAAAVGGMDPRKERRALDAGCHIVVGTPGRLRDHVERKALDLSGLRAVILDEADEMLDMGFKEDLTFLLEAAPAERRTLMFSATLPKSIVSLAQNFQTDAFRIAAAGGETGHADISYVAMQIGSKDTEKAVVNVLREKNAEAAIIFCRTRESVKRLHALLSERGFTAVCLSGELSQGERNHALQALRDGRAKVCVATDVAARGIDLPHLSLVIHADLPLNAEVMQHRSGRTGRAGRKGTSILLVPPPARRKAERLFAEARIRPTWGHPPDADAIRAQDRERFLLDPMLTEEITDDDRAMGAALLDNRPAADVAALLARLYRSRLPEPEDLSTPQTDAFDDRPGRKRAERIDRPDSRDSRESRGRPERGDRFSRSDRAERFTEGAKRQHPAFAPQAHESAPVEARGPRGGSVVFRLSVGRKHKADPKWLLPMVCRRGDVSRNEIGAFRIFEDMTEVDISASVAEHFAISAARKDSDDIRVTRADHADGDAAPARAPFRKPRDPDTASDDRPPFRPQSGGGKPYAKPFSKSGAAPDARQRDAEPYENRKPYAARTAPAGDGAREAGAGDFPPKKRFPPKEGPRTQSWDKGRKPDGPAKHARTGFQHRKGTKGKRPE